jgi:hypothetical protein
VYGYLNILTDMAAIAPSPTSSGPETTGPESADDYQMLYSEGCGY